MEFLGSKDEFHEPPKWERMEIFGGFSISFFESKSRELYFGGPKKTTVGLWVLLSLLVVPIRAFEGLQSL